jgi:hypothetical protein
LDVAPWVQRVYEGVDSQARQQRHSAMLPMAETTLEQRDSREFFHEIRRRIATAEVVVAVFEPGDVACAIEATIASVSGKKVLMVAKNSQDVPRLLEGLPGVRVLPDGGMVGGALADLLGETAPRPGAPRSGGSPRAGSPNRGEMP